MQGVRVCYVILAHRPGAPNPEYLEDMDSMSVGFVLTGDVRRAKSCRTYADASAILERMSDFGAFPDHRLTIAEVEAILRKKR